MHIFSELCPKCYRHLNTFISGNLFFKYCKNCGYTISEYRPPNFSLPVNYLELKVWLNNEEKIAEQNSVIIGHGILKEFKVSKDHRIGIIKLDVSIRKKYVKSLRPYDAIYYGMTLCIINKFVERYKMRRYVKGFLVAHTRPDVKPTRKNKLKIAEPTILYRSALKILNTRDFSLYKFINYGNKLERRRYVDSLIPCCQVDLTGYNIDDEKIEIISNIINLGDYDYLGIEGPPGTGKTTTIAIAACELVKRNYRVLMTSHTNVAIDNALERIIELEPKIKKYIIRLGHPAKVSPKIRELIDIPKLDEDRITWIKRIFEEKRIFGMTIAKLAVLDIVYKLSELAVTEMNRWPLFDYIFIDEASMVPIGIAVIPIYYGKKWVVLGDTRQLSPITRTSQGAPAFESILELINVSNLNKIKVLTVQRRGRREIFNFISRVIYQNMLKTPEGIHQFASKIFSIKSAYGDIIDNILSPEHAITWVDIKDGISDWIELRRGRYASWSAYNPEETALAVALYSRLHKYGISRESMAIITTYRAQAILIRETIEKLGLDKPPIAHLGGTKEKNKDIELYDFSNEDVENLLDLRVSETVDSFQGREKPIIIYSVVKHYFHKALGYYARFNVAVSRAKSKLIVLSSLMENELTKIPWIFSLRNTTSHRFELSVRKLRDIEEIFNVVKEVVSSLK